MSVGGLLYPPLPTDEELQAASSSTHDLGPLEPFDLDFPLDVVGVTSEPVGSTVAHAGPTGPTPTGGGGGKGKPQAKPTAAAKPASAGGTRRVRSSNKEEQQRKRRERNRVLAKRTRLRKKYYYLSLQKQVSGLHQENQRLKGIITSRCGEKGSAVLKQCKTEIPAIVTDSAGHATNLLQRSDYLLVKALNASQPSFCITDPRLPDNPIVYASVGFMELTGFSRDQVVGRNCRFLQGPDTDAEMVTRMKVKMAR
jgi:PAS domain-containing protein